MQAKTVKITWNDLALPIHQGTLYQLGGGSARIEWEMHGDLKGHGAYGESADQMMQQELARVQQRLEHSEMQPIMRSHLTECMNLMHSLVIDPKSWKNYLGDRRFIFIVGGMRSGGTYLYSEMMRLLGRDHLDYNMQMTHDGIPNYHYLMHINNPGNYIAALFELCQWLVWVKKHQSDFKIIIQKRIGYMHCMAFLDTIFGNSADYIITLRHPITAADSFAKMMKQDVEQTHFSTPNGWAFLAQTRRGITAEDWQKLNYYQQFLIYWEILHMDVVQNFPYQARFIPVTFSSGYRTFLEDCAKKLNQTFTPGDFQAKTKTPAERHHRADFENTIQRVKSLWQAYGIAMPELEFC